MTQAMWPKWTAERWASAVGDEIVAEMALSDRPDPLMLTEKPPWRWRLVGLWGWVRAQFWSSFWTWAREYPK